MTNLNTARKWVGTDLRNLFEAEIRNEDNGGIRPATLSSTIDSIQQMPKDILSESCEGGDAFLLLTQLLVIRDHLPGDTRLDELLAGDDEPGPHLTAEQKNVIQHFKAYNVPATWFVELRENGLADVIALGENFIWSFAIERDGTHTTSEAKVSEFTTGIDV